MHSIAQASTATPTSTNVSPAEQMTQRILDASRARLVEALPDAVTRAMQKTLPREYTPELADDLARAITRRITQPEPALDAGHRKWCEPGACITREDGDTEHIGAARHIVFPSNADRPLHLVAQLGFDPAIEDAPVVHLCEDDGNVSFLDADGVVEAARRAEVLATVLREAHQQMTGAGPLTDAQRTFTFDEGLGARRTTPVETEMRDIDCQRDRDDLPWLSAEVVVCEYRPRAYGRETRVWLHNGPTTGELTPAQAREALEAIRDFAPKLEAVIALAEKEAAGDFEGDPEIARLDREAEDRRIARINEGRA